MKKFYQSKIALPSQGQQSQNKLHNFQQQQFHHLNADEKDFLIRTLERIMEQSADALHKMYHHYKNDDYEALIAISKTYHEAASVLDEPKFNELLSRIENEQPAGQHFNEFLPVLKELKAISQCTKDELSGGITMLEHRLDHEAEPY